MLYSSVCTCVCYVTVSLYTTANNTQAVYSEPTDTLNHLHSASSRQGTVYSIIDYSTSGAYKGKERSTLYMSRDYRKLKSAAVRCCYSELGPFFVLCSSLLPAFTFIHASSCSSPTKTSECYARATISVLCGREKPSL